MTCASCGTPLVPGARFCFACGAAQGGGDDAGTERRIVTVLFGDLSEFTAWAEDLDPERVGVVTDRLLAALSAAVADVGGHVDKLTGDGIMAVFGAPTSHEDDPQRAVLAAAAMQQEVARLVAAETGGDGRRLGLRVGLNTGEVLAGIQAHLSYTVVGDTVNTASRLSDAAGVGAVFAGRDTAAATMQVASWRTLRPLRLKGKREPVEAYELLGLRGSGAPRPGLGDEAPTIGREAETGALVGALRSVVDRSAPASVLLLGDAGIGKTRLAQEIAAVAGELPGGRVLWAQCSPYGLGRDLAPLAQMVRTACGVGDEDTPDTARERVERAVARLGQPPHAGWSPATLTAQLGGLLGLSADRVDPLAAADVTPGLRAERPDVDGVVALVSALALEGPVLLVVDDVHLARDPLAEAYAEVLARVTGPVLLVGCGRDGGSTALGWPEVVPLGPLDRGAAERLLAAYLQGGSLDEPDRDEVLDRAEGNPFFLAELLHLLVDRGLLAPGGDRWTLREPIPADLLPAGVQAVLAARIDSLTPAARGLLRDAAVLGASFRSDALVHIDPRIAPAEVDGALTTLVDRGILVAVGRGRFAFAHTLTREVAYAGLPKGERARRHAGASAWATAQLLDPTVAGAEAGELRALAAVQADRALHLAGEMHLPPSDPSWRAAGPGLDAALRLGRTALARDDNVSAETHLLRALRLAEAARRAGDPHPGAEAGARVAYAEALAGQRRLTAALEALALPLEDDDPTVRAGALLVLGDVRRKQVDDDGARTAFVQAFTLAGENGLDAVTGGALRQLGLMDMLSGRLRDAERRFADARELAVRTGDDRGAGWALQHLAWSATTRADYPLAEDALSRASEVFALLQDTGGLAWCAGTEALVRMLQGRLAEARDLVGGLLPVADQMGAEWESCACRTIDAIAAAELGDLEVAGAQAALAVEGFERLGDPWGRAMAALAQGVVARAEGRTRDARTALRRAASFGAGAHRTLELLASVVLGLVHLDRGDTRAAGQCADAAELIAAELDLSETAGSAQLVLRAQVLRGRGRLAEAHALLETAAAAQQPTFLFPARQAVAHLAGVLLQEDEVDAARAMIEQALTVPAEDVRSHVVTQRVLAQVLSAAGDAGGAATAAAEALRLVQDSGLVGELATTRRVLAKVG